MNITVIFTGGTIGSIKGTDGVIKTADSLPPEIGCCLSKTAERHSIRLSSPINMLSETANAKKQNIIISECRKAAADSDAIIVTHGTDTLPYTAALLDYALFNIKIPVALVSSGYVLSDPRANGVRNLEDAFTFVQEYRKGGVFVVWNSVVHRGVRVLPPQAYTDDVKSLSELPFGIITDGHFIQSETDYVRRNDFTPYPLADENRRIITITPAPGTDYNAFTAECDAFLHLSYHSGTVDTENKSFTDFCSRMRTANVPVFLHGSYPGAFYETKKLYDSLGVIMLPVMSASACYEKLLIADFDNISKPLCGDLCLI